MIPWRKSDRGRSNIYSCGWSPPAGAAAIMGIELERRVYRMLALFRNADFAKLFFGRMITNAGDSLYMVAAMWLVYELGGSAFYTGLAGFVTLAPQGLQFLTGPLVDRWPLRNTLIYSQMLQCVLVLMIPLAAYTGWLSVTVVLIVMPLVALIEQFTYPAQTAALPRVIGKGDLVKGNSAFSFAYQGSDLAFNALAGVLVSVIGAVSLYVVDSVTFMAAATLFFTLKFPRGEQGSETTDKVSVHDAFRQYGQDLAEGFRFVFGSIIAKIFVGSIIANFAIGATLAVMPAYADDRGGAEIYGFLMAALSAGSLLGALAASFLGRFPLGGLSIISFTAGSGCWVASVFVPWDIASILLFGLSWVPVGATNVIFVAAIQRLVPERLLARTFSVIASIGTSAMPLGSLAGGSLAAAFGSVAVFAGTGFGILFAAIVWLFISDLRRLPAADTLDPEQYGLTETTTG